MPKNENQKIKLYYLYKILLEKTDDTHYITMPQILEELAAKGIIAERRSIYRDIDILNDYTEIEVIGEQWGSSYRYHVGQKQFELAELKLLVDAVQSSKFITERKSDKLIKKITTLASKYEAQQLKRQVHVQGRIKTMNESIFYNVDEIHTAIDENKRISFRYMRWDTDMKLVPRLLDSGEVKQYDVSPWALTWDDENYYLIAYESGADMIKHYRVDKMLDITVTDIPREGQEQFDSFDMPRYTKSLFGMFGGEETRVTLEADNDAAGILIDRFGKDLIIMRADEGHFKTVVSVAVSSQFLGWVMALGGKVRIVAPASVAEKMRSEAKRIAGLQ